MKLLAGVIFFIVASVHAETKSNPRGICPRATQGIGICKINPTLNCNSDSSCTSGKICCPDGCNRICQYPEKPIKVKPIRKPGKCKNYPPKFGSCVINPATACANDEECSGSRKCCNDGCNLTCQYPVGLEPQKDIVKAGVCKRTSHFGACVITDKTCSCDSACPGTQKCCSDGCNLTCQDPETKPGPSNPTCPPKASVPCAAGPNNNASKIACRKDANCEAGHICCISGCGSTCVKVLYR